jgi:hypothetical protein
LLAAIFSFSLGYSTNSSAWLRILSVRRAVIHEDNDEAAVLNGRVRILTTGTAAVPPSVNSHMGSWKSWERQPLNLFRRFPRQQFLAAWDLGNFGEVTQKGRLRRFLEAFRGSLGSGET